MTQRKVGEDMEAGKGKRIYDEDLLVKYLFLPDLTLLYLTSLA